MIIPILLGVVTLVALVAAFMASKYWHWAHVLVMVSFYFASVGFVLLAAQTLSLRLESQKKYRDATTSLEEQIELNRAIGYGTQEPQLVNKLRGGDVRVPDESDRVRGIIKARHEVAMLNRARGRVWRFARPLGIDPQTNLVEVGFPIARPRPAEGESPDAEPAEPTGPPPALGLEVGAIVYVFEQGPPLGSEQQPPNQYLGEFRVEGVDGRKARLQPLDQFELDGYAAQRYLNSKGPWIVYESMPSDSRVLFAGMGEERLRALLPEKSVEEYLRDNTPSTPDDAPERLVGLDENDQPLPADQIDQAARTVYRRQLRDYALLFDDLEKDRARLVANRQAINEDLAKLAAAQKNADELQAYRRAEREKWLADKTSVERDLAAIQKLSGQLQKQVGVAEDLLLATLQSNARLAAAKAEANGRLSPVGPGALDIDAL